MTTVPPEDEYVHNDYPRDEDKAWKENWYFNFIDRENNAWGINHISLERHKQQGRFSALHVVDGEILMHLNYVPLTEDFKDITDGLSKTVAASEIMLIPEPVGGGWTAIDLRGRYHNNMHGGCSFSTLRPPNTTVSDRLPYCSNALSLAPCVRGSGSNHVISARSYHPDGVGAVMADGSVRFVSDTINPAVWQAAGSRNGGEVSGGLE